VLTADLQMQLDVLIEVLREDPDVLTLQALAGRVLAKPRSLTGGIALARVLARSWTTRAWSSATASWCGRADRRCTSST
jgi:hypothetical protein